MDELSQNLEQIIKRAQTSESEWENEVKAIELKLQEILLGNKTQPSEMVAVTVAASPKQIKKRPKRLTAVVDEDECEINEVVQLKEVATEEVHGEPEPEHIFARPKRLIKMKIESFKEPSVNSKMRRPDTSEDLSKKIKKEPDQRQSQAVAKKSNKSNKSAQESMETIVNESRASQKKVDESVIISEKELPVVELLSEEESVSSNSSVVAKKKSKKDKPAVAVKNSHVKVKKEKFSLTGVSCETEVVLPQAAVPNPSLALLKPESSSSVEETLQTTTSTSDTTATARSKRGRKKKEFNHRPIKEERLSIEDVVRSPVSTRSRSGSTVKPRPASVYEDAVDNIPQRGIEEEEAVSTPLSTTAVSAEPAAATVCNETVATNNATMMTACDATFVANQVNSTFAMQPQQTTFIMENNPNATVTIANGAGASGTQILKGSLGDATFDVREPPANDSIMTEDESFEKPLATLKKFVAPQLPPPVPVKALKPKSKANELFNPCVQSPVKKKVEAFEHHAQNASEEIRLRNKSKRPKENTEPELPTIRDLKSGTVTTPVIGKMPAPALGRFLTPTQKSNLTPTAGLAKKLPNSASKIMQFPTSKQSSASNLKSGGSSTSSQSLSRENSEDDLKKGFNKLQQLAEERKKKRELKHQQAAAIREAREKERAERLKKIMKEREEKNRKKALELEQKKRELEEINRNLKVQEEREMKQMAASQTKLDAAEAARQDRELLEQMKQPRMKIPQPPKQHNKYNFNMLHSDDSTDEEGKTSYKRPTPPQWSKSSVRAEAITAQSYLSSDIIDSFFSVQPMTPDLKSIFPNIDPRHLKRNSSAIWQTPPRYSEMPKY